ncbi:hypothetical protein B0H10DRAFT_1328900 [Mycena sp. CBHHK59/15]|nr:hypothetical protein B0H10DRAFT_1328900 [Mycena sp. CBHHK59/15]
MKGAHLAVRQCAGPSAVGLARRTLSLVRVECAPVPIVLDEGWRVRSRRGRVSMRRPKHFAGSAGVRIVLDDYTYLAAGRAVWAPSSRSSTRQPRRWTSAGLARASCLTRGVPLVAGEAPWQAKHLVSSEDRAVLVARCAHRVWGAGRLAVEHGAHLVAAPIRWDGGSVRGRAPLWCVRRNCGGMWAAGVSPTCRRRFSRLAVEERRAALGWRCCPSHIYLQIVPRIIKV